MRPPMRPGLAVQYHAGYCLARQGIGGDRVALRRSKIDGTETGILARQNRLEPKTDLHDPVHVR